MRREVVPAHDTVSALSAHVSIRFVSIANIELGKVEILENDLSMRWSIEIRVSGLERRNLVDLLAGLGFELVAGNRLDEFTSLLLDQCKTASEAFEIGKTVREAFRGPSGVDPEFSIGGVVDYSTSPPGKQIFIEINSIACKSSLGSPTLEIGPPKGLSGPELKAWERKQADVQYQARLERQRARLEPAYRSKEAEKVMDLLQQPEPSGETIYKIYELMVGGTGNRPCFHKRYNIGTEEFDRFRDAVHNPRVSGDWARHSVGKEPRTKDPMKQNEALRFVKRIAKSWLENVRTATN